MDYVMLYVYKDGARVRVILFHDPDMPDGCLPEPFDGLEVKTFGRDGGKLTFDLDLMPGEYHFVLLCNDFPSLAEARKGKIRNPQEDYPFNLAREAGGTPVLATGDFGGEWDESDLASIPVLMPMTGQQKITVPRAGAQRVELAPAIPLERVLARVALFLTTAKDDKEEEYAHPALDRVRYPHDLVYGDRYKSLFAYYDKSCRYDTYVALPVRGEYSATTRDLSDTEALYSKDLPDALTHLDKYREKTAKMMGTFCPRVVDYLSIRAWNDITGFHKFFYLGKVWRKQALDFIEIDEETELADYHLYIPPLYLKEATEKDMPYIRIAVCFSGDYDPSKETQEGEGWFYYRIPLYTVLPGGSKEYSVRRNTYYRIYARLLANSMEITFGDGILVRPFKVVHQVLKIDPADPSMEKYRPSPNLIPND